MSFENDTKKIKISASFCENEIFFTIFKVNVIIIYIDFRKISSTH